MYTLVFWTIVGYAGTQFNTHERMDWRPLTTHTSKQSCEAAAAQLNIKPERFRCVAS